MEKYRPEVGQIGSQLDSTFFLFDNCVMNTDKVKIEEYERMMETDETVAAGLQFLTLAILMKIGEYTNENPKVQQFVRDNFEDMQGNLYTACEEILTALWAGFSGSELVWKPDGSRITLDKIVTYHPKTLLVQVDRETGAYQGLKQWRWFAGSPVDLPANKAVLYTVNRRFGNYYGQSMLKPPRKNWLLKDPILKMWGRALDRFGTPLLAAFTSDEEINDPQNPGQKVNQLEYVSRILAQIKNGSGLAFKNGSKNDGTDSRVDVLTTGGTGIGEAFHAAVTYLNKMIMRGLLVPSLMADDGSGKGSFALGQAHFEVFDMTISSIFGGLIETLIEQIVRPMVEYNFGKQRSYGTFTEIKLAQESRDLLSTCFMNLTNAGYLTPTNQDDMDAVREAMKLPLREVEKEKPVDAAAMKEYKRYISDEEDPDADPQQVKEKPVAAAPDERNE